LDTSLGDGGLILGEELRRAIGGVYADTGAYAAPHVPDDLAVACHLLLQIWEPRARHVASEREVADGREAA
jgi:hypothetical protein